MGWESNEAYAAGLKMDGWQELRQYWSLCIIAGTRHRSRSTAVLYYDDADYE
jgi:hypothetical protein